MTSNIKLNTGWKTWDKFLSIYVGKKINIMEIGVYKGGATQWFLKNIMTNTKSKIYAIDTFEGSPEYQNKINFKNIKTIFNENIKKTGKEKQVEIMEMYSDKALIKLLNKKNPPKFDIIFIDASHEARDVISDGILSWKLLNENGTIIFDDYRWNKIKQPYFRPKMAIDAFMNIMKPELKVLSIRYQVLLRKKLHKNYNIPNVNKSKNII